MGAGDGVSDKSLYHSILTQLKSKHNMAELEYACIEPGAEHFTQLKQHSIFGAHACQGSFRESFYSNSKSERFDVVVFMHCGHLSGENASKVVTDSVEMADNLLIIQQGTHLSSQRASTRHHSMHASVSTLSAQALVGIVFKDCYPCPSGANGKHLGCAAMCRAVFCLAHVL